MRSAVPALFALSLGLALVAGGRSSAAAPHVDVLAYRGSINPVSARLITTSLATAQADGAAAFVLELDTPGGGIGSMRVIAGAFLNSRVPVIVYVAPAGARAGSAGTFLAYAAQLAAMAPGTEIGAAHPVGSQGGNLSSVEDQKATNDAVAMITAWARQNGKNAAWAADAVRQAASLPADAALAQGVVNAVAPDLPALLRQLDGAPVHLASGDAVLHTAGAAVEALPVAWWLPLLLPLADPNLAYLLLTLGTWAFIAEFFHPALIAGVAGAVAALLGLLGLEILSVSTAGVALVLLGLALLLLDIKAPTHGVLTAGGTVAFVLGSLLLFRPSGIPGLPVPSISPWLILAMAALSLALGVAAVLGLRHRPRAGLPTGAAELLGHRGRVTEAVRPADGGQPGQVAVGGSYWRATSRAGELAPGTPVRVVAVRGLVLEVEAEQV